MTYLKNIRAATAAVLAALIAAGALAGPAASASAQTPDQPQKGGDNAVWTVNQQVFNKSRYKLTVHSVVKGQHTYMDQNPADIPAGGQDTGTAFNDYIPNSGPSATVTYDVRDATTNQYLGAVSAASGIDCTRPSPGGCLDYHRWERGDADGGGLTRATWTDNHHGPEDFVTYITFSNASLERALNQ